jgi:hypothetical protein
MKNNSGQKKPVRIPLTYLGKGKTYKEEKKKAAKVIGLEKTLNVAGITSMHHQCLIACGDGGLANILPGLFSNLYPPDLRLLSNWDYSCVSLCLLLMYYFQHVYVVLSQILQEFSAPDMYIYMSKMASIS